MTWSVDRYFVEAAGQSGVLHDGVPVFVLGSGPDYGDFTSGQSRLQDVAHPLGAIAVTHAAGTEDLVDFVKEEDDIASVLDFLDQVLDVLLKGAPVLGPGFQAGDVDGNNFLVLDCFRHVPVDNCLG